MKVTKKIVTLLLSAALILAMMPCAAFAGENAGASGTIEINKTNFPDLSFRKYVKTLPGGDDGKFTKSEISEIEIISCDYQEEKIESLKGIEFFTSLKTLFCCDNALTTLDVSKNRQLVNLDCSRNRLTSVNTASNRELVNFDCRDNRLKNIDISRNEKLMYFYCDRNQLKEINTEKNPELDVFWCSGNHLKNLHINRNRKLTRLYAYFNDIVYINTSENRKLEEIYYIPERIEMNCPKNFDYTKIDTFEEFMEKQAEYDSIKTIGLTLDRKNKKISLKSNNSSGKIQFIFAGEVDYELTFFYDKNAGSENFSAELNHHFTKAGDKTYKYVTRGKHVNAEPVVKAKDGTVLEKGKDYTVEYNDDRRTATGKYVITVKGAGKYKGTVKLTLIILPGTAKDVKVRQVTIPGGYDDAFLTWDKVTGADGYQIYERRPAKTSEWTYAGRTEDTDFLMEDLYDGRTYEFKVIPYVKAEGMRYRTMYNYSTVSMTTLAKLNLKPVKKYSDSRIQLTWEGTAGADGYQVKAERKGKTTYFKTKETVKRLTVAKKKPYTYKVRAYVYVTKNHETYRVNGPWSDAETCTLK